MPAMPRCYGCQSFGNGVSQSGTYDANTAPDIVRRSSDCQRGRTGNRRARRHCDLVARRLVKRPVLASRCGLLSHCEALGNRMHLGIAALAVQ